MRINDKIAELELQVEPLRQQAEKAKKYLVLRDELRPLEISVWLHEPGEAEGRPAGSWQADSADGPGRPGEGPGRSWTGLYAHGGGMRRLLQENDCSCRGQCEAEGLGPGGRAAQAGEQESAAAVAARPGISTTAENIERMEAEISEQPQPQRESLHAADARSWPAAWRK